MNDTGRSKEYIIVFFTRIDKQRVHSFGVIWIWISDPRSICLDHSASKEPMNPFWLWIYQFLRCSMIQTDRSWITDPGTDHPKERSPSQENILSHLAKSDGNIRIWRATIAYEMRVYSQGVKASNPLWSFKKH